MRQAGIEVTFERDGQIDREISTLVDRSAYRIVQEALTNVAKHAPRARTRVTVQLERDALLLSIVDDGSGDANRSGPSHEGGRGLIGMRERVAMLGGRIEMGQDGEAGFAVRACLPIRDGRS
jgi:signal transduction histidine kinase